MKTLKHLSLAAIILGALIFLFSPPAFSNSLLSAEVLDIVAEKEVIIIFNSGGWGNTPLEQALDFAPVVQGIQESLDQWGYDSAVIPFERTKKSFGGKLAGVKDFFTSFSFSSAVLAQDLEELVKIFPDKKIVMAGLSNGAAFTAKTYESISEETRESVYAISAGLPFWVESRTEKHLLLLDNEGKDSLVMGNASDLLFSLLKTPFQWIEKQFNSPKLKIPRLEQIASGHLYPWERPEVSSRIVSFLRGEFQ